MKPIGLVIVLTLVLSCFAALSCLGASPFARGDQDLRFLQPMRRLSGPRVPAIDGTHDAYIRQFAMDAMIWSFPFFLRIIHEMNGSWGYPWQETQNGNQRGEFVQAWRHIVDIFRWRIETSQAAIDAWRSGIGSGYYASNQFGSVAGRIPVP